MSLMEDYRNNDFQIVGFVGIDGSPTCGVNKTLSMDKSFKYFSILSVEALNRREFNKKLYVSCSELGPGMFTQLLLKKLSAKGININCKVIDLEKEMEIPDSHQ